MGWELGGRLDVLPENEDDGKDIEPEAFSTTRRKRNRHDHLRSAQWGEDRLPRLIRCIGEKGGNISHNFGQSWPEEARLGRKIASKIQTGNKFTSCRQEAEEMERCYKNFP